MYYRAMLSAASPICGKMHGVKSVTTQLSSASVYGTGQKLLDWSSPNTCATPLGTGGGMIEPSTITSTFLHGC